MPKEVKIEAFAHYVLATYVDNTVLCSHHAYGLKLSTTRRTSNGAKALHRNYYELFYVFHPPMFVFLDNKVK